MSDEYAEKLENVIKQMLKPIKNIPFKLVIEGISGFKVLPFDNNSDRDKKVLETLMKAAIIAGSEVNKLGIHRPRPNEVGNDVEPYVISAINGLGYKADKPSIASGKKKSTGYPDIIFTDENSRINYLECKTYNIKNISTTQRSFYVSPSEDFKVTHDAIHFALSYEMCVSGTEGDNKIYRCASWKILTLEDLFVDLKYEFQSNNKRLYAKGLVLAEGKFEKT